MIPPVMRVYVPAVLLAVFVGWCGTFYYGAVAAAVAVGHLVLLAAAAWGWRGWDPLRLGRAGRALPPLLWLWLALSLRASPAPRAGWVAVALLPVMLALPAVVASCWKEAEARRRGVGAVAAVGAVTAVVALAGMALQGSPRAAQPLGNAVVLGAVLATLAPLSCALALGEHGRRGYLWKGVGLLVAVGILASRSQAGVAAAIVGLALVLPVGKRRWLLVPIAAAALLFAPRLVRLAAGEDLSVLARLAYWRGGIRGVAARPLVGWGPGATGWTLAPLLRPRPGVNPPGEVVGDLHSLPLQLAYELGLPGLAAALALAAAFTRARLREGVWSAEGGLARGGVAGLAAGATALVAGPTLGTTAPWVALAVAAGAALTEIPAETVLAARRAPPAGWLFAAIAALLLAPLDGALACYDAARRAPRGRAVALLQVAAELDPEMPLYRARLGWLAGTAPARALALRRAAAGAPGVPSLQLAAGWAAQAAGQGGEVELLRSCAGDPLSGTAPFLLAQARPGAAAAGLLAARAVLADPPLLAATAWEGEPELLAAALEDVGRWDGVDEGLRSALMATSRQLTRRGRVASLRVTMDETAAAALSLHVFRRLPWPATLAVVTVRRDDARRLSGQPAAGSLRTTRADAFPPCAPIDGR